MQDNFTKLISLLEHKHYLLETLVEEQERFKSFLEKPDLNRFREVIRPQEDLVVKLRQVQAAQSYLLDQLAQALGVQQIPNLKLLANLVESEAKQVVLDLIEKIRGAAHALRQLTRQTQILNQAEWTFHREYDEKVCGPQQQAQSNVYSPHGYGRSAYVSSHVFRHI